MDMGTFFMDMGTFFMDMGTFFMDMGTFLLIYYLKCGFMILYFYYFWKF